MTESLSAPFLAAARAGTLVVQTCGDCGAAQLPPRLRCERCGGATLEWAAAAGTGRLCTFAVLHRAPDEAHRLRVPYVYAVVELDEGPRVVSNVVECDAGALRAGAPLSVRFETDADGQPWPVFTPSGDA